MNQMLYGLSAAQTFEAAQSLYEAKLITYARTESIYIIHDDLATVQELISDRTLVDGMLPEKTEKTDPSQAAGSNNLQYHTSQPVVDNIERLVSDSKVAGHTAILPTRLLNAQALEGRPSEQRMVAKAIVMRLWEAIGKPAVYQHIRVSAHIQNIESPRFTATNNIPISLGWKAINTTPAPRSDTDSDEEDETQQIPSNIQPGITVSRISANGGIEIKQGKTTPPKSFSDATLLADMENASKFVDDHDLKAALNDDTSHSEGIGTPATRAKVMEELVADKYLQ